MPVVGWTTPKTWVSGLLPSTDMNTYVRDNENFLYQPPMGILGAFGSGTSVANNSWVPWVQDTVVKMQNGVAQGSNNGQMTFQVAGWYEVTVLVRWVANGTGDRGCGVSTDGTTTTWQLSVRQAVASASYVSVVNASGIVWVPANSSLYAMNLQSSGGNLTTDVGGGGSQFSAVWVSG